MDKYQTTGVTYNDIKDRLVDAQAQITLLQQTLCSGENAPVEETCQRGLWCVLQDIKDNLDV